MGQQARVARLVADFHEIKAGYLEYYQANRAWPPDNDGSNGQTFYAAPFFTVSPREKTPSIGGLWNWNQGITGNSAALPCDVCIYSVGTPSSATATIMTQVDQKLDDGNLSTGLFVRQPGSWGGTYRFFVSAP